MISIWIFQEMQFNAYAFYNKRFLKNLSNITQFQGDPWKQQMHMNFIVCEASFTNRSATSWQVETPPSIWTTAILMSFSALLYTAKAWILITKCPRVTCRQWCCTTSQLLNMICPGLRSRSYFLFFPQMVPDTWVWAVVNTCSDLWMQIITVLKI